MSFESENNLTNFSLKHPMWKHKAKCLLTVMPPKENIRLEYEFVSTMYKYIGKTFTFYTGCEKDWWNGKGYIWHSSWLMKP